MKNKQNNSKFDGTYKNYFQWILNEYKAQEKTRYNLFAFQNINFLAYRFNDYQHSIGEALSKIRHSVVTDNYLVAEEIQNQNWQYFIERVIEVCKSKEEIKPNEEFLLTTAENTTIPEKAYETFYNIAQSNFNLTINKISVDEQNQIKEYLLSKNYWWENALTNLDSWIAFYYELRRFPGSDNFTNVPNVNVPSFLQAKMPLSPLHLFKKFKRTCFDSWFSCFEYLLWRKPRCVKNCCR